MRERVSSRYESRTRSLSSTKLFTVEFAADCPKAPNSSPGLQEPISSTENSTVVCSHDFLKVHE